MKGDISPSLERSYQEEERQRMLARVRMKKSEMQRKMTEKKEIAG